MGKVTAINCRRPRRNAATALFLVWFLPLGSVAQAACSGYSEFGPDRIGMNSLTFQQFSDDSGVLDALQRLGVKRIRTALFWGIIQRQQGEFRWRAIVDPGLDAVRAFNRKHPTAQLQMLGLLDGPTPCWTLPDCGDSKSGFRWVPPMCGRPQDPTSCPWYQFVYATVSRYKDTIHYWEIWNEPNLYQALTITEHGCDSPRTRQTPTCVHLRVKSYVANVLIPAERAIRAADPAAKIVAPTFAGTSTGGANTPGDLKETLAYVLENPQAGKDIDVVSLHVYPPSLLLVNYGKAVRELLDSKAVDKPTTPIWLTETGALWNGWDDHTSAGQTWFLNGEFQDALKARNPHNFSQPLYQTVFWYQLLDSVGAGRYGLFESTTKADKKDERQSFKMLQCMTGAPAD